MKLLIHLSFPTRAKAKRLSLRSDDLKTAKPRLSNPVIYPSSSSKPRTEREHQLKEEMNRQKSDEMNRSSLESKSTMVSLLSTIKEASTTSFMKMQKKKQ
ncbi:hypothetical protein RRG08_065504 [Elysia crispata]|uniref:Uncharacterized protein n=1 Tax=Elysia crispata TaxID=231223 RepID=A0AAE1DJM2_9GAST|nr:hypothetical protein RRG08_065504 [Elysia crispata]